MFVDTPNSRILTTYVPHTWTAYKAHSGLELEMPQWKIHLSVP